MSQEFPTSGRGPGFLTGFLMTAMGFFVLAITFGLVSTDAADVHAPPWVLAVFGGMFVLAGLWIILLRLMRPAAAGSKRLSFVFAIILLAAISAICLWIGFGPGPRTFVDTNSLTGMRTSLSKDPVLGRLFFGAVGVLLSAVTVAIAWIRGRELL